MVPLDLGVNAKLSLEITDGIRPSIPLAIDENNFRFCLKEAARYCISLNHTDERID
jgi:hypothetical protein